MLRSRLASLREEAIARARVRASLRLRPEGGIGARRFGERGGEAAVPASRLPPRIWGTSERRPSCRVRLPTAVLRCASASFLEPFGEAVDAGARLLAAGGGAFQAAGEQAGALLGPAGALFEQGRCPRRPWRDRRAAG